MAVVKLNEIETILRQGCIAFAHQSNFGKKIFVSSVGIQIYCHFPPIQVFRDKKEDNFEIERGPYNNNRKQVDYYYYYF